MVALLVNVISGIMILFIFLLIIVFDYKNSKNNIKQIKLICLSGTLVALAVSLNTTGGLILRTVLPFKIFEIKIGDFVLVLIGFICGGLLGAISGIATDFLGLLFLTNGSPCLFFTFTSILWCVLPYYLVLTFSKIYHSKKTFYLYLPIAYGLTSLIITSSDPIVLKILYNLPLPWWAMYSPRIIKYPIDLIINASLVISCYTTLKQILNLENQFKRIYFPTDPQSLQYNKVCNMEVRK